ncbi:MAG: peroxiredoxin [Gammaproteobacteria bacterium]|nr:peroxiredoxin [Gammaproteobacteria bacterium]
MLPIGATAPDFTLPDENDTPVRLSALLGTGPLILYFYPADFTPGCTREACALRDLHDELSRTPLAVCGVSPQSTASHRRFKAKYRLPFRLLSDPDKTVIRLYGCDGPFGFGVRRASYLIGRDGRIEAAVLADFFISEHERFFKQVIEKYL